MNIEWIIKQIFHSHSQQNTINAISSMVKKKEL